MKNKAAQKMGKRSWEKNPKTKEYMSEMGKKSSQKRFAGKTKEEISQIMRDLRLKKLSTNKE